MIYEIRPTTMSTVEANYVTTTIKTSTFKE
jgi:hypothetical protein